MVPAGHPRLSPDPPREWSRSRVVTHECPSDQERSGLSKVTTVQGEGASTGCDRPTVRRRCSMIRTSCRGGLAAVVALVQDCRLGDLVADKSTLKVKGGVNAQKKVPALVAGMVAARPRSRTWTCSATAAWSGSSPASGAVDAGHVPAELQLRPCPSDFDAERPARSPRARSDEEPERRFGIPTRTADDDRHIQPSSGALRPTHPALRRQNPLSRWAAAGPADRAVRGLRGRAGAP